MSNDEDVAGSSYKPRSFFKVLLEGFENKLRFPPAFVRKNFMKRYKEITHVSLLGPTGNSWTVQVDNEEEKEEVVVLVRDRISLFIFGDRWRECVHAHELRDGYFLLFHYEGNLVFNFNVFDLSCCNKLYPSSLPRLPLTSLAAEALGATQNCREEIKVGMKRNEGFQPQRRQGSSSLEEAGEGYHKYKCCPNISFERVITESNIRRSAYIYIPKEFGTSSGLLTTEEDDIICLMIRDQKGKLWPVNVFHTKSPNNCKKSYFVGGWRALALANGLKLGDRCIFSLESAEGKRFVVSLRIIRA